LLTARRKAKAEIGRIIGMIIEKNRLKVKNETAIDPLKPRS
jgi:hypothetical protein